MFKISFFRKYSIFADLTWPKLATRGIRIKYGGRREREKERERVRKREKEKERGIGIGSDRLFGKKRRG